jgi:hypothetical protein
MEKVQKANISNSVAHVLAINSPALVLDGRQAFCDILRPGKAAPISHQLVWLLGYARKFLSTHRLMVSLQASLIFATTSGQSSAEWLPCHNVSWLEFENLCGFM